MNEIFYIANLINYVTISIAICAMGALLMVDEFFDDFFKHTLSVLTITGQIFMLAWMGNKLTETVTKNPLTQSVKEK